MGTSVSLWLVLVTMLCVANMGGLLWLINRITNLPSLRDAELNDKMDRVLRVAESDVAIRNDAIRRNLIVLLELIEKDPMSREKYYDHVATIRRHLNQ